jgi:hypothetical protein
VRARSDRRPAEMNSPQTLRRGNGAFSTIATDQPARASSAGGGGAGGAGADDDAS